MIYATEKAIFSVENFGSIVLQLTIFDLDKTLTFENVSYLFGKYLFSKKVYSFPLLLVLLLTYTLHAFYLISSSLLHRISFYLLFYKKNTELFERYVTEFLQQNSSTLFRSDIRQELQRQQLNTEHVYIMSTSPSFLVQAIAKLLKVDKVVATEYEVDDEGRFSHIKQIVDGDEKKRKALEICKNISPSPKITLYSDSMRDFPLFKICQNPIAVYPEKRLRRFAKNNDWRIIG